MKKLSYLLIISFFLISCNSSQKMLERGQYDRAIDRATEKLMKKPNNSKELSVLKEAYELANMFDKERIEFLELEGREESWVEIYELYEQLNWRQNKVRRLPSQIRNEFTFYNYDNEIVESKMAAAEVSYERGVDYLERGDKMSARQAYNEFERAAQIYPGYEDVDQKLYESHQLGMNHALYFIENNSGMVLPEFFDVEMKKTTLKDLNTHWLNFDTYENENIEYDYFLVLNITEIAYSPETVERRIYSESREIQDGLRYELDEDGNVKKDSTGTDIRVPNMVTVTAEITESEQKKTAFVAGSLDIYDLRSDQLLRTESASVEAVFQHRYGEFSGNRKALSEETEEIIGGRAVPFPGNEQMLMDATELLKNRSKTVISRNRRLLEN
ncbi:hypothetical protein [Rhodohalobacter sp.]|uniref:tetratricopeptide repeat protein n=1 Tax=Rhodohalobacter sp. TaxID=1974210 RepID=UPI002ACE8F38|nr:hypothetical protein [Rhodohalobacter sp.]MDZ7754876.1 hypothetical protein [Rhodohalobacter sp.]